MARRKEFLDIARGLASSFDSRNNDFQGYWALGILYQFADKNKMASVEFDLLKKIISPQTERFTSILTHYNHHLIRLLSAKEMNPSWLKYATLNIYFNLCDEQHHKQPILLTGEPYILVSQIIDDNGRVFESKIYGKCRCHDPTKELKSNR